MKKTIPPLAFKENRGKPILTLDGLMAAVKHKKAVFCPALPCFNHHMAAAFLINMSGTIIYRVIDAGLFVYKGKEK